MTRTVIYLFVLVASAYARVTLSNDELPDISNNDLIAETKPKTEPKIIEDLPTYENSTEINNDISELTTKVVTESNKLENSTTTSKIDTTLKPIEGLQRSIPTTLKCGNKIVEITDNTVDFDLNKYCGPEIRIDNGTALILTPYVEEGRILEARNASRVNPDMFLGIESYSGFFTVNKTYNSNLFFWYFPIQNKPVNETPWIIWLQGGPGASSMTGLFDEIGPFFVDGKVELQRNPHTWLQNHSLLFIENPVGTGFSFTNHHDGFTRNMETYGTHLYTALRQFMRVFPELQRAPLFVAGESYAGKYVPALAVNIHRHKEADGGIINLQGMMVGNAYVDPPMISQMANPFYYFGLMEAEEIDIVRPLLEAFQKDIAANRSLEAKTKWNHLITVLLLITHQKHAYNFLRDDLSVGRYVTFLQRSDVKRALHVGDIKFNFVNMTVNTILNGDFLSSAKPIYEELLDHYRVLAYCGHLDQMLPCVMTSQNYRTWRWGAAQEFMEAQRYPYMFNKKLAGYYKSGGRLTEVIIRGAGHMAPMDAPAPTQRLVALWSHGEPLGAPAVQFDDATLRMYVKNNSHVIYL